MGAKHPSYANSALANRCHMSYAAAMTDAPTILASVQASYGRRILGVGSLGGLGLIVLWTALRTPPAELAYSVFMIAVAAAALFCAWRMWDATQMRLILTEARGLEIEGGEVLAPWDQIETVERGMLAFKPSNGFLITLKDKAPRAWAPGVYWRLGRKIGVGGVTGAGEGKAMADILAFHLAQRDGA